MGVLPKVWIILKLLYSCVIFWTFHTPEKDFYTTKANYYSELGWYERAEKSFKKTQNTFPDAIADLELGFDYAEISKYDVAIEAYRRTMRKPGTRHDKQDKIGLAIEEYQAGHLENSEAVIRELRASSRLEAAGRDTLDLLEAHIEVTKRARSDQGNRRD